eukprot:5921430-Prymnesium_polylepis.1
MTPASSADAPPYSCSAGSEEEMASVVASKTRNLASRIQPRHNPAVVRVCREGASAALEARRCDRIGAGFAAAARQLSHRALADALRDADAQHLEGADEEHREEHRADARGDLDLQRIQRLRGAGEHREVPPQKLVRAKADAAENKGIQRARVGAGEQSSGPARCPRLAQRGYERGERVGVDLHQDLGCLDWQQRGAYRRRARGARERKGPVVAPPHLALSLHGRLAERSEGALGKQVARGGFRRSSLQQLEVETLLSLKHASGST